MDSSNLNDPGSPTVELRSRVNLHKPPGRPTKTKDQEKIMANLKDIVATLAILSAGTLTLTGCKKDGGETTNPDAGGDVKAGDSAGTETPAEGDSAGEGEASCSGEGEASCSGKEGEDAPAEGEGGEGEASCSGAA
jgi:hypothetical protein